MSIEKLKSNALALLERLAPLNIKLNAVTKAFASEPAILDAYHEAGIRVFSDSRVVTGRKIKKWAAETGKDVIACLLRPPSIEEAAEAVRCFDRFYISDLRHACLVEEGLEEAGRTAEIVLMVETGDRREGFLLEELDEAARFVRGLKRLKLVGIGTNTVCSSGKLPEVSDIELIIELTEKYCGEEGIPSPGNSGALYLLKKNMLPPFGGELRIGEGILLGNETVEHEKLDFLSDQAFLLEAEVLEMREKSCDKIQMVVALGIADVGHAEVVPLLPRVAEERRSSDHMVLSFDKQLEKEIRKIVEEQEHKVSFRLTYFSLLQAFLTPTVYKEYLKGS